eukprot:6478196-Prymnesium_polylepis.1
MRRAQRPTSPGPRDPPTAAAARLPAARLAPPGAQPAAHCPPSRCRHRWPPLAPLRWRPPQPTAATSPVEPVGHAALLPRRRPPRRPPHLPPLSHPPPPPPPPPLQSPRPRPRFLREPQAAARPRAPEAMAEARVAWSPRDWCRVAMAATAAARRAGPSERRRSPRPARLETHPPQQVQAGQAGQAAAEL